MSRICEWRGAGRCRPAPMKARRSCTTACSSSTAWATASRRSTRGAAICCGSIAASCRRASRPRSSAAWRSIAIGCTSAPPTPTSSRSTRRAASSCGIPASATRGCARAWPAASSRRAGRSWWGPPAPALAPSPGPADRRPRRRHRADRVARQHDRTARPAGWGQLERHPHRAAERRLGLDHRQLRPDHGTRLLRHRQHLRHRPAPATVEQARCHQRRALHEHDAGHRSRYREDRLALPASSAGAVGSRLGVRAADRRSAGSRPDAQAGRHRRQDRHLRRRRGRDGTLRLLHRSRPPEHRHRHRPRDRGEVD